MPKKMSAEELDAALGQFTGSEEWHHSMFAPGLVYSDGVKFLVVNAGAFWLIDTIASYQRDRRLNTKQLREFQLWTLHVNPDRTAVLTCYPDTGKPAVIQQDIEFTDFPLDAIRLYVEDTTLLLPSEH
jgi:hypothetical protein